MGVTDQGGGTHFALAVPIRGRLPRLGDRSSVEGDPTRFTNWLPLAGLRFRVRLASDAVRNDGGELLLRPAARPSPVRDVVVASRQDRSTRRGGDRHLLTFTVNPSKHGANLRLRGRSTTSPWGAGDGPPARLPREFFLSRGAVRLRFGPREGRRGRRPGRCSLGRVLDCLRDGADTRQGTAPRFGTRTFAPPPHKKPKTD